MSIEEKYDEIRALMAMGKEKGYLLYEEINELLPADVTSAEELDDLFSALGHGVLCGGASGGGFACGVHANTVSLGRPIG